MGKGQVSIGDDTPTGEPENAPQGPYITDDEDDMSKPEGGKKDSDRGKEDSDQRRPPNRQPPSRTETAISEQSELGSDRAGR